MLFPHILSLPGLAQTRPLRGGPPAGSNLITDFDLHIYNDSGKNAPCYLSLSLPLTIYHCWKIYNCPRTDTPLLFLIGSRNFFLAAVKV
jgi:hypothetical protein